jgi:hypothetical protein
MIDLSNKNKVKPKKSANEESFDFNKELRLVVSATKNQIERLLKLLGRKDLMKFNDEQEQRTFEIVSTWSLNELSVFLVRFADLIAHEELVVDSWKIKLFKRILKLSPYQFKDVPLTNDDFFNWIEEHFYMQTELEFNKEALYSYTRMVYLYISGLDTEVFQALQIQLFHFLFKNIAQVSKGKPAKEKGHKSFKTSTEKAKFKRLFTQNIVLDSKSINQIQMLLSFIEDAHRLNREFTFQNSILNDRNVELNKLNETQLITIAKQLSEIDTLKNDTLRLQINIQMLNNEIQLLKAELEHEKGRNESKEKTMLDQLNMQINELIMKIRRDIGIEVSAIRSVLDNMTDKESAEFIDHYIFGVEKKLSNLGG